MSGQGRYTGSPEVARPTPAPAPQASGRFWKLAAVAVGVGAAFYWLASPSDPTPARREVEGREHPEHLDHPGDPRRVEAAGAYCAHCGHATGDRREHAHAGPESA